MKIEKSKLTLEEGIKHEWLITNGIGGYAASTVIGINTRKYHGLLVAPLTPPARRHIILSKLDESIQINNNKYDLYSNMCVNYIAQGYKYQQEFEKEYIPIFTYKVENILIKKLICMEHGKNTVCVLYKIYNEGEKAKLTITPIVNFRDFHCVNTNHEYDIKQEIQDKKVRLEIDQNSNNPIYMYITDGNYIPHKNDTFRNMFYIEEERRGLYPEENLAVPGRFEVEIPENTEREIGFICSLEASIEELNIKKIINKEIIRINELMQQTKILNPKIETNKETKEQKSEKDIFKNFIIAIDNFIVYRPSFGYHTIIAGYPWFLDWGRDSLISFEGLLLCTKQYKIAKDVLLTMIRDMKFGLVPNGYSGYDNRPLYNSSDSSLLLFEQIHKYIEYTKDYSFIKKHFYNKLKTIIENYKKGINLDDNNIFLDDDYLISAGTPNTQNTWMDAKYKNHSFTPRNGKAVEINALWYNALMIMAELSIKFGNRKEQKEYLRLAEECQKSFLQKFYNSKRNCLYDVLGDNKVRPNQLFALSLTYPVVNPESDMARNILDVIEKKLLNKYGLKTLAKGEKGYVDIYEGDVFKRDSSYHQGITWPWLLGLYYNSIKNMIKYAKDKSEKKNLREKLEDFRENVKTTFKKELFERGTIGSISEIYDSKKPNLPKGTMAQAWSVAEIFRIIYGF